MSKLGVIVGVVLCIGLAWSWVLPSTTVRYRLTLEAEVDGKPVSGSGILEASYSRSVPMFGTRAEAHSEYRGDAVVLDLGRHGLLFALLTAGSDPRSTPQEIFLLPFGYKDGTGSLPSPANEAIRSMGRLSGKGDLPLQRLPLLVRFRDINDPKTVEKVDPANLAASFGAGVRLTRATIEMVGAGWLPFNLFNLPWPEWLFGTPITRGIETRLVWLAAPWEMQRELLKGPFWDSSDPKYVYGQHLTLDYFQLGR